MKVKGLVKNAATKAPVAGVKVVLTVGERELAVLFSDREGHFEYMEEKEYVGQKLNCRVGKDGFEPQETTYKIDQDEIFPEIELVPVEKKIITPPTIWPKIAMGIAAVIVIAIVIYLFTRPSLKIVYFKADPPVINTGDKSKLRWKTENAVTVTIDEIGKVKLSGSEKVTPQTTTTYTLIAKDKTDERSETCKVEVRNSFVGTWFNVNEDPPGTYKIKIGESGGQLVADAWRKRDIDNGEGSYISDIKIEISSSNDRGATASWTMPNGDPCNGRLLVNETGRKLKVYSQCQRETGARYRSEDEFKK